MLLVDASCIFPDYAVPTSWSNCSGWTCGCRPASSLDGGALQPCGNSSDGFTPLQPAAQGRADAAGAAELVRRCFASLRREPVQQYSGIRCCGEGWAFQFPPIADWTDIDFIINGYLKLH